MAATTTILDPAGVVLRTPRRVSAPSALLTLARRRAALTAHNPRQIAIPLLTPILFSLVLAAGALFPLAARPGAQRTFARCLPLAHAGGLMRYGFVDRRGTGLHDIWGMSNPATEAWLSLAVVAAFALVVGTLAIRSFSRS